MRFIFTLFFSVLLLSFTFGQTAQINEFHYDNVSTDQNEFVEVLIDLQSCDPSPCDPTDFDVVLYNGNGGMVYDTDALPSGGNLFSNGRYGLYIVSYPTNGIQNGNAAGTQPDGIALVYNGGTLPEVIEFISYEGSFIATGGPALGQTSTDIGVEESNDNTAVTESLQQDGFPGTWQAPMTSTAGQLNAGQEALPVTLSYFTAAPRNDQVHLRWETTQEINNDYFRVQRSVDSKTWTDYGDKIAGHGTTDAPQRYAFVDQQPLPGVSYYRLQQTDYDGTEHFHPVERVDMRKAADITVFPNPANGTVYLEPPAETTSAAHIRISTLYGQLVRTINAQNGTNELHLADLLPGQYLIEWIDEHATYRKSLIVR